MADKKFKDTLEALLKKDSRLVDENKELNLAAIRDLADKTDSKLIELLLSNDEATKKFFLKVKDVLIFKQNDFKFFLDSNQIDNSYTAYENRIGLTVGGKYLKDEIDDVVLNFPYKDCVLEGGQTTEEGTDEYFDYNELEAKYELKEEQHKEIFFNEVIAKDEIDRLEEPKAFTNIKKYTVKGEEKIKSFARDENGTITDNLIIKGNNLLTLHSLKEEFTGQVKLIYIDPPYNTGNDSFKYNNKFNHSTWLTFMKNRLEIAIELLSNDGVIFIQCDDNEQPYLKILCDSVFNSANFVNCIAVKMSEATSVKMAHAKLRFPKLKEYLLFYKKNNFPGFYEIDKYRHPVWDNENNIYLENFTTKQRELLKELEEKEINEDNDVKISINILSKVKKVSLKQKIKEMNFKTFEDELNWKFENSYRIIKTAGAANLAKKIKELNNLPLQDISAFLSSDNILFFYFTDFNRATSDPRFRVIFADSNIYKNPCDFWQDIKTSGAIADEGG